MKRKVNKHNLIDEYITNDKTTRELAKYLNVCQRTICNYLNKFNIKKDKHIILESKRNINREKALKQHRLMSDKEREIRIQNIKKGRLKSIQAGKRPGHFVPHTEKTKGKIRNATIKYLSSGKMPNKMTLPERLVKQELELLNFSFKMQYGYKLGVADFYIPQYNAVIECDGNYWHNYPIGTDKDLRQTLYLVSKGYNVYRFWESDIKEDVKKCIETIRGK